jgi:hypothetical protein
LEGRALDRLDTKYRYNQSLEYVSAAARFDISDSNSSQHPVHVDWGLPPFEGNLTSTQVSCTLSVFAFNARTVLEAKSGTTTTCMQVTSKALANHQIGPWSDGGNWNDAVVNYAAYAIDCKHQAV